MGCTMRMLALRVQGVGLAIVLPSGEGRRADWKGRLMLPLPMLTIEPCMRCGTQQILLTHPTRPIC